MCVADHRRYISNHCHYCVASARPCFPVITSPLKLYFDVDSVVRYALLLSKYLAEHQHREMTRAWLWPVDGVRGKVPQTAALRLINRQRL